MTGTDIRRYRKMLDMDQRAFAARLAISQSALSMIENGRMAIPQDYLARLTGVFDSPEFTPPFSEFLQILQREQAQGQAALAVPYARQLTLLVWAYTPDFDLSRAPAGDQVAGAITVPFTDRQAIALRMPKATQAWAAGEILVFEICRREDFEDNDICMVQVRAPRDRQTRTIIGLAHVGRATRGHALHIEPLSPSGPMFPADDESGLSYLRVFFRARDVSQ
jgi:transcriptional regulator with XRE-family HTH domain